LPDGLEQVATPARYTELIAAGAGVVLWIVLFITKGPVFGLESIWLLLIALGVGAWTTGRRLRFSPSRVRITFGPWSREVDLTQLESIRWKPTAGVSEGFLVVRDRSGHRVPIELERFKRRQEWGRLLLDAAEASGATLDKTSREILQEHRQPIR
jgi:hypothetical protein